MQIEKYFALAGVLLLPGCGNTDEPTFCVYRATDVQNSAQLVADPCSPPNQPAADDALVFVHELPKNVEVDAELELTLSTPCTTVSSHHDHPERRLLFTALAPPGAACLLTVSATILNASNTIIIGPNGGAACASLDEVCKPTPAGDAGAQ